MAVGGAIKTDEMSRETGFPVPVMAVVDLISKRRLALNSTQYEEFELSVVNCSGDAENARHEIAGHENVAPECKGEKCET